MTTNEVDIYDGRFIHPFTCVVAGQSGAGKSTFIQNLIYNSDVLISSRFDYIIIFQGVEDPSFQNIVHPNIEFHIGLPIDFSSFIKPDKAGLFVIDDLQSEITKNQDAAGLFQKYSAHNNLSIILTLQNLYCAGKERVNIIRNSNYIIIFNSPLDLTPICLLSRRIAPHDSKALQRLMFSILKTHRYIILDGKQSTPIQLRFRTDIFNGFQRVFYPYI